MMERELIAERTICAIDKDSREFEIQLMVGKPYQVSHAEWACPVAMMGLHGVFPDMRGVDSWQALTIAQQLIRGLLTGFVEDGGKLFAEKDGEELTVDNLFAGRSPRPRASRPPLTKEQYQERIDALTPDELQQIDNALMAGATTQFRKVARIVGIAMTANEDSTKRIPDDFYASRVRRLVEEGRLISEGDLDQMRRSEVRLPD